MWLGGSVTDVAITVWQRFVWVLLASGTAWIMGAGRVQAAACLDGAGPRVLGHISSRTGVPAVMALVSVGGALTVAIALIVLAYLMIFPSFLVLRYRRPDLERPFRVPGGPAVAWLVTLLSTGWSVLATLSLTWPGVGTAEPDAARPAGFAGERLQFEALVLSPVLVVVAVATALYLVGRLARRA